MTHESSAAEDTSADDEQVESREAFRCKVFSTGGYEGSMSHEAVPHILNAVSNILRSAAYYLPEGTLKDGFVALETQAQILQDFQDRLHKEEAAALTPAEMETLDRFRKAIEEDKARAAVGHWEMSSLLSVVVIAARHFATGESIALRRALLETAAEVTGVPMELVPQGVNWIRAWRPAQGEVGWLPYRLTSEAWMRATPIK